MMKKDLPFQILLFLMCGSIFNSACKAQPISTPVLRDLYIMNLLIGLSDIPYGWQLKGEPERFLEVGTFDAAKIAFTSNENARRNGASFGVYNYGTSEEAQRVFIEMYKPRVYDDLPPGWNNPQIFASQHKVGCYDWEGREPYACTWAAQYHEFIVQFDSWIIPGFMSFEDFERVVIAIDGKMQTYLEMPPITPIN